jgi:hypothetical protein
MKTLDGKSADSNQKTVKNNGTGRPLVEIEEMSGMKLELIFPYTSIYTTNRK